MMMMMMMMGRREEKEKHGSNNRDDNNSNYNKGRRLIITSTITMPVIELKSRIRIRTILQTLHPETSKPETPKVHPP